MADRVVFRDPSSGRFISRAAAQELEDAAAEILSSTGTLRRIAAAEYFQPAEEEPRESLPRWSEAEGERGMIWSDFESGVDAFDDFDPPEDADAFRVFFDVDGNDEYPRNMASSVWLGIEQWPPSLDMLAVQGISSFNQIRFRRV